MGLLLISTPLLTSLKSDVVVFPFTLTVNSVAAIPVNDREISSKITFLSCGLDGSNCLDKNLPVNMDPVCRPAGSILPYGGVVKYKVSPTILKSPFNIVEAAPIV